jgi:phage shock protein A
MLARLHPNELRTEAAKLWRQSQALATAGQIDLARDYANEAACLEENAAEIEAAQVHARSR